MPLPNYPIYRFTATDLYNYQEDNKPIAEIEEDLLHLEQYKLNKEMPIGAYIPVGKMYGNYFGYSQDEFAYLDSFTSTTVTTGAGLQSIIGDIKNLFDGDPNTNITTTPDNWTDSVELVVDFSISDNLMPTNDSGQFFINYDSNSFFGHVKLEVILYDGNSASPGFFNGETGADSDYHTIFDDEVAGDSYLYFNNFWRSILINFNGDWNNKVAAETESDSQILLPNQVWNYPQFQDSHTGTDVYVYKLKITLSSPIQKQSYQYNVATELYDDKVDETNISITEIGFFRATMSDIFPHYVNKMNGKIFGTLNFYSGTSINSVNLVDKFYMSAKDMTLAGSTTDSTMKFIMGTDISYQNISFGYVDSATNYYVPVMYINQDGTITNGNGDPISGGSGAGITWNAAGDIVYSTDGSTTTILPAGTQDQILRIGASGLPEWYTSGIAATTFLGLTDTPTDFTGNAGKLSQVNLAEDALEFTAYKFPFTSGSANDILQLNSSDELEWVALSTAVGNLSNSYAVITTGITGTGTASGTATAGGLAQELKFIAGNNISITVADTPTADTITISAITGSGGSGTVANGMESQIAYYASNNSTVVYGHPRFKCTSDGILSLINADTTPATISMQSIKYNSIDSLQLNNPLIMPTYGIVLDSGTELHLNKMGTGEGKIYMYYGDYVDDVRTELRYYNDTTFLFQSTVNLRINATNDLTLHSNDDVNVNSYNTINLTAYDDIKLTPNSDTSGTGYIYSYGTHVFTKTVGQNRVAIGNDNSSGNPPAIVINYGGVFRIRAVGETAAGGELSITCDGGIYSQTNDIIVNSTTSYDILLKSAHLKIYNGSSYDTGLSGTFSGGISSITVVNGIVTAIS